MTCVVEQIPALGRATPEIIQDGVVAWDADRIVFAGPAAAWDSQVDDDVGARAVVPGFVDCHTHLPFFGWRDDEFEARLRGATYRDLHGEGGIARSARLLAQASDDEVREFCRALLTEMLDHGTTTLELKTGYGLSVEAEMRQARLAREIGEHARQTTVVSLLACHAAPREMTRESWVEIACRDLIPRASSEGVADAVDVYVEDIAFSIEDLRRVAEAAAPLALPLRCHADQLGPSGATEAAIELGARSVDHLNNVGSEGIRALARGRTAGVLLPASTFLLRANPPPVAEILDGGAAVAVATDFNPGTSAVLSMPEAIALACSLYGLSPLEALVASTINAAWVLGLESEVGSLEPGKRADFLVLDAPHVRAVPYRPGHNPVVETFVGGEPVLRG